MLIVGQGALARPDGSAILAPARALAERYGMVRDDWCGFNVLHTAAARVGGLDLGLVPGQGRPRRRRDPRGRRQRRDRRSCSCSAPTRSTSGVSAMPS